jgi:hypothetical protein
VSKQPKCRPGDHVDHPVQGSSRVRCVKCGDVYPCTKCEHLDCILERGEELPEWAGGPPSGDQPSGKQKKSSAVHTDCYAPEPGVDLPTQPDRALAPTIPPIPSARHEQ